MSKVLSVSDLNVHFQLHESTVHAVKNLSFSVEEGETLAVVGESGSGKSQAFLSIMGLLARNGRVSGHANLGETDLLALSSQELDRLRGNEIAMIFQDPMTSLNPSLKIISQLTEVLQRHQNLDGTVARNAAVEMLERVGIPDAAKRANAYAHQMSGGMRQRIMIAMALLCRPKILIADEPTTALDVTVQAQMLDLFRELTAELGTALIIITHDLGVVAGLADKMMVMYGGQKVEHGTVEDLFETPHHPYTLGLLNSTPRVGAGVKQLTPIEGLPPSLENLPSGCTFHPRCAFRQERCMAEMPPLDISADGRQRACYTDIANLKVN